MKKTESKKTVFLDLVHLQRQRSGVISKRSFREGQASIPSLEQASRRDQMLEKMHRWKKESKASKLQETYDENIRLFISLKKQQSEYKLKRKLTNLTKLSHLKLPPLTQLEEESLSSARTNQTLLGRGRGLEMAK